MTLLGRDVPRRSDGDRADARAAWGSLSGPWCRAGNGASSMPRWMVRRRGGDPSLLHGSDPRVFEAPAGRSSDPRRSVMTGQRPGWPPSANALTMCRRRRSARRRRTPFLPAIKGALAVRADQGDGSRSRGYEGSELLVARLLIESGAEVPYVGTACPRTRSPTRTASGWRRMAPWWSIARRWRTICRRWKRVKPDLAIGTTPVVQKGKEARHHRRSTSPT